MLNHAFTYFAFISYSHKDEKWAKWIQHALESYRLPAVIRKKSDSRLPKKIQPVFRDKTDLSPGFLHENLCHELDEAEYLIVVCSPNSATPNKDRWHWVNEEVKYFCKIGRAAWIIPVIINGLPHEAFCPKLQEIGLAALNVSEQPRARILNDIVAKILGLRPDELWQRELRRQRKIKFFCWLAGMILFLSCCAAGWFVWDYYIPKTLYYEAIRIRNMEPEGVNQIPESFVKKRPLSFKLRYRHHLLEKMQVVNSRGHVRCLETGIAEIEVSKRTDSDSRPQVVHYKDSFGKVIYQEQFLWSEDGKHVKSNFYNSFSRPFDNPYTGLPVHEECGMAVLMNVPLVSLAHSFLGGKNADVRAAEYELDDNGFLKHRKLLNRYGKISIKDPLAEISSVFNADSIRFDLKSQMFAGLSLEQMMRLQNGRTVEVNYILAGGKLDSAVRSGLNLVGGPVKVLKFDEFGNCLAMELEMEPGNLMVQTFEYKYDAEGFLQGIIVKTGKKQGIVKINSHGDAEIIYGFINGRTCDMSFFYQYHNDNTFQSILMKGAGQIHGVWIGSFRVTFTPDGKISCMQLGTGSSGSWTYFSYSDKTGLLTKEESFGDEKKTKRIKVPFPGKNYSKSIMKYLDDGRIEESIHFDTDNQEIYRRRWIYTARNQHASEEIIGIKHKNQKEIFQISEFDQLGRITAILFSSDEKGWTRVLDPETKVTEAVFEYEKNTTLVKKLTYYGVTSGQLVCGIDGSAIKETDYDEFRHPVREATYDEDKNLCLARRNPYSERICIYEKKIGGKLLQCQFRGAGGSRMINMPPFGNICGLRYQYDPDTAKIKCIYALDDEKQFLSQEYARAYYPTYNSRSNAPYQFLVWPVNEKPMIIRSYVLVKPVDPNGAAAKKGIRPDSILISAPGFDDRGKNDFNVAEKTAMLHAAHPHPEKYCFLSQLPNGTFQLTEISGITGDPGLETGIVWFPENWMEQILQEAVKVQK